MSDLEERLSELLDDVAGEVTVDQHAPPELVTRVRRRRHRRAATVTAVGVVALVGAVGAALGSVDRDPNHEVIAGPAGVEMVLGDPGPAELLVDQLAVAIEQKFAVGMPG